MNKDYIGIAEFAEIAGVSVQSIYKRLKKKDNPLQPYYKEVEGKKFLRRSALLTVYGIKDHKAGIEDPVVPLHFSTEREQPLHEAAAEKKEPPASEPTEKKDPTERLLDLLEQQLKEKDLQLKEKDKQIQEKDDQISSLLDRIEDITRVADQQQKLSAADKGLLPPGNANTVIDPVVEVKNAAAGSEESPEMDNENAAEPKKKGFFSWFRG